MISLSPLPPNANYLDFIGMFSKGLTLQRHLKMEIFHILFPVCVHVSTFSCANNPSVVDVSCLRTKANRTAALEKAELFPLELDKSNFCL